MKKQFSLLLAAMMVLPACAQAQDQKYVITGRVADSVKFVRVYLNRNYQQADTIKVLGGKFKVKGKAPRNAFINVGGKRFGYAFLNDGKPVNVDFVSHKLKASAENEAFAVLQDSVTAKMKRLADQNWNYGGYYRDTTEAGKAKYAHFNKWNDRLLKDLWATPFKYARDHKNWVSPIYWISDFYNFCSFADLQNAVDSTAAYYHHPWMEPIVKYYKVAVRRQPGAKFIDFEARDTLGNTHRMSQYVGNGHYTLVDCWHSWMPPMGKHMTDVATIYNKYHASKGFEAVAVACYGRADEWKRDIKRLGMTWPQVDEFTGKDRPSKDIYGFREITYNFLVGPDGVIVAVNLYGNALLEKLREIYGE